MDQMDHEAAKKRRTEEEKEKANELKNRRDKLVRACRMTEKCSTLIDASAAVAHGCKGLHGGFR